MNQQQQLKSFDLQGKELTNISSMNDYSTSESASYKCGDCGRKYRTQETLNRHKNVHSAQVKYICHICKATFLRSDVLSRHFRIHSDQVSEASVLDKSLMGRKRSPRACKACRASKIKCNSANPCNSCIKSGHECVYVGGPNSAKHSLKFDSSSPTEQSQSQSQPPNDSSIDVDSAQTLLELSQDSNPSTPRVNDAVIASSSSSILPTITDALTTEMLSDQFDIGIPNIWSSTADWSWMYEYNQYLPQPIVPNTATPSASSHYDVLDSDNNGASSLPSNPSSLIEYLIQTAIANVAEHSKSNAGTKLSVRDDIWYQLSERIETVFHLQDWRSRIEDTSRHYPHILYRFMTLYFDKFNLVFAFFWRHGFDFDSVPPLLCLTLGMVGAMFDGDKAAKYGSMLHDQLCPTLAKVFLVVAEQDDQYIPLLVSTLVTQIIAVYSGDPQRLIYAQQISGVLITQARRLNLFSTSSNFGGATDGDISQWIRLETRKRIAFAIFLNDTYLSMLMNSRPLVSPEEINLELPCSDELWTYKGDEWRVKIMTAIEKEKQRPRMFFSDLYRILLDKDELLGSLEPQEYRMLLLSMQQQVWRFSNDPEMFRRLCGQDEVLAGQEVEGILGGGKFYRINIETTYNNDHLSIAGRKMERLRGEYLGTNTSLNKWRLSFASNTQTIRNLLDRQVILSSQVTYHSLFIVLNCPINLVHNIANNPTANLISGSNQFKIALKWARSERAKVALYHVKEIWNILSEELKLPEKDRAFFNIASPLALYHGAVVIWVYLYFLKTGETNTDTLTIGGYELKSTNRKPILESVGKLMRFISQGGLGVSYARHIDELANREI